MEKEKKVEIRMRTFFIIRVIEKEIQESEDYRSKYLRSSKEEGLCKAYNIKDAIKFANYEETENYINLLSDIELSEDNYFAVDKIRYKKENKNGTGE